MLSKLISERCEIVFELLAGARWSRENVSAPDSREVGRKLVGNEPMELYSRAS